MTFKEKIQNLTWADLTKKIKDIFLDIDNSFKSLTKRVSSLEANSGGDSEGDFIDTSTSTQSKLGNLKVATVFTGGGISLTGNDITLKSPGSGGNIGFLLSRNNTTTGGFSLKSNTYGFEVAEGEYIRTTHKFTIPTLKITDILEYADNDAATLDGLIAGDVYKTSVGALMIVF